MIIAKKCKKMNFFEYFFKLNLDNAQKVLYT